MSDQEQLYEATVTCPRGHQQTGHAFVVGDTVYCSSDCDFCNTCEDEGHETSYLGDQAWAQMRDTIGEQHQLAQDARA